MSIVIAFMAGFIVGAAVCWIWKSRAEAALRAEAKTLHAGVQQAADKAASKVSKIL
jgi:hypothetical protein